MILNSINYPFYTLPKIWWCDQTNYCLKSYQKKKVKCNAQVLLVYRSFPCIGALLAYFCYNRQISQVGYNYNFSCLPKSSNLNQKFVCRPCFFSWSCCFSPSRQALHRSRGLRGWPATADLHRLDDSQRHPSRPQHQRHGQLRHTAVSNFGTASARIDFILVRLASRQ